MRRRFQSLRPMAGLSAAAGLLCLAAFGAAAQERPYAAEPPAPPVTVPLETAPPVIVPGPRPLSENAHPPRPALITNPTWARPPAPEYPALALAQGVVEGRVTVQCIIFPNGALTNCVVLDEAPVGVGFRESVLASVVRARVSPRTVDGAAVAARVVFTVRYRAPQETVQLPPAPPRR